MKPAKRQCRICFFLVLVEMHASDLAVTERFDSERLLLAGAENCVVLLVVLNPIYSLFLNS